MKKMVFTATTDAVQWTQIYGIKRLAQAMKVTEYNILLVLDQPDPFLQDISGEVSQIVLNRIQGVDEILQHITGMLDHIPIWKSRWPVLNDNVCLHVCCNDTGTVTGEVVNQYDVLRRVSMHKKTL